MLDAVSDNIAENAAHLCAVNHYACLFGIIDDSERNSGHFKLGFVFMLKSFPERSGIYFFGMNLLCHVVTQVFVKFINKLLNFKRLFIDGVKIAKLFFLADISAPDALGITEY